MASVILPVKRRLAEDFGESILRSSFLLGDIGAEKHEDVHLACPVCAADEDVCIGAFAHGHDAWEVSPAD